MAFSNQSAGCIPRMTAYRSINPSGRWTDRLLRQSLALSNKLQWKDLVGHYGCVNAIEFSHGPGQYIASGGDDRRVLLWDVEKALSDIGKPSAMKGEHHSNIFCVAFDISNSVAFSGGNDEQVIVHDLTTGETKDVFSHDDAVYGLSPDPTNPSVFASSCDDGRVLIYDTRDSCADPFCLANYTSSMHSVMYNPVEPRLLATANAKEGVGLWDVRKPRSCLLRYGGSLVQQSCMSVRFNQRGDQIIALRRRLPPVMYKIDSNVPVCEFDHSGYYNSCTMKSISFAGDNDQYVLSGSDEFNLYMWAVPDDLSERSYVNSAHMLLKGHRSIVNQVRFNPANHLIMSSGVEKIIKVWSPFKLSTKEENNRKSSTNRARRVYSHEEYINLVLQNGNVMSHDYSMESTDEDPRMMAFFDSLVQRELDGWSSDDSMSSNEEALYSRIVQLSQSDIDSDESLPDLGQNDDNYSPFTIAFASVMAMQSAEGNDRFPRLNRALENAERSNTAARAEMNEPDSPEEEQDTVARMNDERNPDDHQEREVKKRSELSDLIMRKKQELRVSMKRRLKYAIDREMSDSSLDSDEFSDIDENVETDVNCKTTTEEKKESTSKSIELGKSKEAKIKLTRLKNLRNSVMNNDSDAQDLEIGEKTLDVGPSTSSSTETEGDKGKVQFKKFKRKNQSYCDKSDSDKKTPLKSSSDLGPFLKKTGTSSSNEGRRTSVENEESNSKGKKSSDSYSVRGKHKYGAIDSRLHSDSVARQHSACNSGKHSDENDSDDYHKSEKDTRLTKGYHSGTGKSSHHSSHRSSKHSEYKKDRKEHASSHRHYYRESSNSHKRKHDGSRDRDRHEERKTGIGHHRSSHRRKSESSERGKASKSHDQYHRENKELKHRSNSDSYTVVVSNQKNADNDETVSIRGEKRTCHEYDQEIPKQISKAPKSSKSSNKDSRTGHMDGNCELDSDGCDNQFSKSDYKSCHSNANQNGKTCSNSHATCCNEKLSEVKKSCNCSIVSSKEKSTPPILDCAWETDNDFSNNSMVSHDGSKQKLDVIDHDSKCDPLPGTSATDGQDSSSNPVTDSPSDNQLTWLEFKRFKNKLERARKRYDMDKGKHRDKRSKSDD